jgi:hypothetical protein
MIQMVTTESNAPSCSTPDKPVTWRIVLGWLVVSFLPMPVWKPATLRDVAFDVAILAVFAAGAWLIRSGVRGKPYHCGPMHF